MSPARTIAAIGAVAAWGLYVWTGSGRLGWSDAAELAAAGQQLGIAHAPGEPAYLLLVRLAQLVPLGDLAARALWLSAAVSAGVVGASVLLADRLLPAGAPRGVALVFVAIATAACGSLWTQGVVVELYALATLLLLVALILALRAAEHPGAALGAGLAVGLAGAINPMMVALSAPALLLGALLSRRRPGLPAVGLAGLGLLLGLSALLYLPLRNAAAPGVWSAVLDDPPALITYGTGRTYGRSFGGGGPGLVSMAAEHGRLLLRWCGLPALLLGAAGLVLGSRVRLRATVAVAVLGLGALGATMTRSALETFTPDVAGYLLPTCLALLILGAVALAAVARRSPLVAWALAVACAAGASYQGAVTVRLQAAAPVDAVAVALLEVTPPGGVLVTGSDSTALPVLYETTAGRRRPDVLAVTAYGTPAAVLAMRSARHPHLAIPPQRLVEGELPEQRLRLLVDAGRGTGVVGTVLLWPPELNGELEPAGLALVVRPATPVRAQAARCGHDRVRAGLVDPLWTPEALLDSRPLRRLLTGMAGQHAAALLEQGRTGEALEVLRAASAIHPDPASMVHLQRATLEEGALARGGAFSAGSAAERGQGALRRGDPLVALSDLERAVTEVPESPVLWEDLAVARFWSGDTAGASSAWDRALVLRPGSPWALAGKERLYSMGVP